MRIKEQIVWSGFFLLLGFMACRPYRVQENSQFPHEVQIIFTNKCATAGCHNDASAQNAAGLNLTSWSDLFRGSVNGTVAIPYAPFQSSLMQFVNTYGDLGLQTTPSMPLNAPVLSRDEVIRLRNWIAMGCPNAQGEYPFPGNPQTRGKAYITNLGCDLLHVVDAESKMVMRCIRLGVDDIVIEQPHQLRIAPDNRYAYICYSNGSVLQRLDIIKDTLSGEVILGYGKWNVIQISNDSKTAFVSDLSNDGRIAEVNLSTMTLTRMWASGLFSNPHGLALSANADTVYATAQYGNFIYRLIRSVPKVDQISLQKGVPPSLTANVLDPHEILMHPVQREYYVTCQASDEVLVMDANTDTVLSRIPVGDFPLEMALAPGRNHLYVSCQETVNPLFPFFRGSVSVIDLQTRTVIKNLYEKFYQPHGIAVDEGRGLLYVVSTNANPDGPAPHHVSECAGRNGFFHVLDINTWQTVLKASELSVFPYSASVKE